MKETPRKASEADSREFARTFRNGCAFWTSEDGSLMAVVIDRTEGWQKRIQFHHQSIWQHEEFNETRAKPRYVYRHWAGKDYFDGGFQRRGKLWSLSDTPTPFEVMYYELTIPR